MTIRFTLAGNPLDFHCIVLRLPLETSLFFRKIQYRPNSRVFIFLFTIFFSRELKTRNVQSI